MATGRILLLPGAATMPDGSASNIGPAVNLVQGSQTEKSHFLVLAFSGASSDKEIAYFTFQMPADYASGGTLKLVGMINSTTGNVAVMQAQVSAVTPADADTPLEHAFAAAATVSITANATEARRLLAGSITLTMDSAAADDLIQIKLFRDAAHASDTHTTDFEFVAGVFEYTTS